MTKITLFTPTFIILSLLFSGSQTKAMEKRSDSDGPDVRNSRTASPLFLFKDHSSSELEPSQEDGFLTLLADLNSQLATPDSPQIRYRALLGEKKLREHREILRKAQIAREIVQEADHNIATEDPELFNELATYKAISRSQIAKSSSVESRSVHALRLPLASLNAEPVQDSSQPSSRVSSRSVVTPRTPKNSPKPPSSTESTKEEQGPSPRTFGLSIKNALLRLSQKKSFPLTKNQESPKSDKNQE